RRIRRLGRRGLARPRHRQGTDQAPRALGRRPRHRADDPDRQRRERRRDPAVPRAGLPRLRPDDAQASDEAMSTFEDVRRFALGLPEAEERLTWDVDITFRVRDKIFAMGGEGATHASIKASPERQAELVDLDPETFAPSAYVGRFGWVTVDLARVEMPLLEDLIRDA